MIDLDDYKIEENTIIDVVVYPGMEIGEILEELTAKSKFKIIIDTEGNLFEKYKEYQCDFHTDVGDNLNKEFNKEFNKSYKIIKEMCNASLENENCVYKNVVNNCVDKKCIDQTTVHSILKNNVSSNESDINYSSSDEKSIDRNDVVQYYLVTSVSKIFEIIRYIKKYKNFILVIDSIVFIADYYSYGIHEIINLLWSVIYECNSTIITVNHYKLTKINHENKLIPRLGVKWEYFISYQILFKYKNDELVFSVKEKKIDKLI